jgi:hypothetical protein
MPSPVTWMDRLRIERVVWALDQRLYDVPRKSRVAKRREVRANLLTAAHDIGARAALRNIGSVPQLAAEYLSAEFGDSPRPHWIAAATFFLLGLLLATAMLAQTTVAFGDGIRAANPNASGTFTWGGVRYLQDTVTYTMADGKGLPVGGAWTPLSYVLLIVATVLVGRLWRAPLQWRRRRRGAGM